MKIGFIAYDTNHLKSDQVLTQWGALAPANMVRESKVFLVPFNPRPPRSVTFPHRPAQTTGGHPRQIAETLGLEVVECYGVDQVPCGMDAYVVLGVGLLENELVENNWVINAHPGIIPYSRGLDSFKWAIYSGRRVGVTLHRLSAEVDMGDVWATFDTPVLRDDSLESFARRHYELEIAVLSRFDQFLDQEPIPVDASEAVPETRRMPSAKEECLWDAFEEYKRMYAG